MEKIKIGYFASQKNEEQYIGGIMITDHLSIPLEFKYTEPIRPTRIHKIIFGKVLEKYIGDDVIKKNLFKEIKNIPAVFLSPNWIYLARIWSIMCPWWPCKPPPCQA